MAGARSDRVVTTPAECRAAIVDVIRGAKREISLSLFRCNDDEIFAELADASGRGVAVNAIVTARAAGRPKRLEKLRQALIDAGVSVSVYADPVVKYHAKYLIADDGPAIVASLNFTKKCFTRTLDALVVTYDAAVVSGLRDLMAADRYSSTAPATISPRLIVGPERARARLTALIKGAVASICLLDAKLSDPGFVALLDERRASGVRVEILGDKRYGDRKSHGKIWLVDNRIAVIGGLALASLSLDFRREVAVIVDDPGAVNDVRRFFDDVVRPSAASDRAARV
jgi:cardiolipin synthase A/B